MPESEISPFQYHQTLVNLITTSKQNFILMGSLLYKLKKDDNYLKAVGEGIDSWVDYLKQPEIGLSKGEANRLVQIYEYFVVKFGYPEQKIADIPIKNLHYILPIVKNTEDSEEVDTLISEATSLSQKDLKERVYEIKHEDEEKTYSFLIMKKCDQTGSLERVYGIDSEEIISKFNLYEN